MNDYIFKFPGIERGTGHGWSRFPRPLTKIQEIALEKQRRLKNRSLSKCKH